MIRVHNSTIKSFCFYLTVYYRFIRENYIMVFQDVRGRFMSEGQFEDIRPFNPDKNTDMDIDEASDTYDAVDWLVKNVRHNNGNMGVMGISYPGFYSTMAILSGHPAIKAVSPQAPVTECFIGDDDHHNGAFFLLDQFSFLLSQGRTFKKPDRKGFHGFKWPVTDNYQFFLDLGPLKNVTANYFGDSIITWHKIMNHPDYDAWLANLRAEKIRILVVARANPVEGPHNIIDPTWFPIERVWAESHPEVFEPIYGVTENDPLFRLYRVRPHPLQGSLEDPTGRAVSYRMARRTSSP